MDVQTTDIPDAIIIDPQVFGDERGFFMEMWNAERYREAGIDAMFVQDNLSRSQGGVLRGLHFQNPNPQGKLVQVLEGHVVDIAVDIRTGSPAFGRWVSVELTGENKRQFYVPPGCAHGFCVLSDTALFAYKCTDLYNAQADAGIAWNDPDIGIDWPITEPLLSTKDQGLPRLKDVDRARLLRYEG